MKIFFTRLFKLFGGILLYSLGIVVTINANIGYSPWDTFHVGLSKTTGISIGNASVITGLFIGILALFLGEKIGIGTIVNMIFIGIFIDLFMTFNIIPETDSFVVGIFMMISGLFLIALATFFYIASAFGAGPRDSLVVALTRKTGLPIGICRGALEFLALLIGWNLGGKIGLGTVLSAGAIGACIQIVFKALKFDATKVKHETLLQTYSAIFNSK